MKRNLKGKRLSRESLVTSIYINKKMSKVGYQRRDMERISNTLKILERDNYIILNLVAIKIHI